MTDHAALHPQDIIARKRDGLALGPDQIQAFVRGVVSGRVSDPQAAAFLMATFLRGLNAEELDALTAAMRFSGETFDSRPLQTFCVDKHSTGGVGDKTSLLIAPMIAAAGLRNSPSISIPMISGRSLGHTGGTLDKLETIPGFRTQLSLEEMAQVLDRTHAALVGQTPMLVPADRILYALRDHTSTVESPHLLCASIMSKKLAAGLNGLVLDVKTGSGAFLQRYDDAKFLAELMVRTGESGGTPTVALLTSMDEPLGRFAGNWLEVRECVEILRGHIHSLSSDLVELSVTLTGHMLALAGAAGSPQAGSMIASELLRSGDAYRSWLEIVAAQGGDATVFHEPAAHHRAAAHRTLSAGQSGFVGSMDCTEVGWAVQRLGAGRLRPGDPVSASAGIEMHVKVGDPVRAGDPLVTLFADEPELLQEPESMLRKSLQVVAVPPLRPPLVRKILTRQDVGEDTV